MIKVIF